jgi:hypothetical protein
MQFLLFKCFERWQQDVVLKLFSALRCLADHKFMVRALAICSIIIASPCAVLAQAKESDAAKIELPPGTAADIASDVSADESAIKPLELPKGPQNPFDYNKQTLQISGTLPNMQTLPMMELGKLLYVNLLAETPPDRTGAIVEATLPRLGKLCSTVSAYQIYRYRTGARTLKVKCPGKPLFVLSVGHQGALQVSGGDGSIGELSSVDGRIYSLFGKRIDAPKVPFVAPAAIDLSRIGQKSEKLITAAPKALETPAAPATVPAPIEQPAIAQTPPEPSEAPPGAIKSPSDNRWLWIANGLGLTGLILGLLGYMRSRRRAHARDDWGLSSDDKDALIDESREVYPDIFLHPQGFYIARGGRGKRRIFKSTIGGILYRDYGLKIGEIRI